MLACGHAARTHHNNSMLCGTQGSALLSNKGVSSSAPLPSLPGPLLAVNPAPSSSSLASSPDPGFPDTKDSHTLHFYHSQAGQHQLPSESCPRSAPGPPALLPHHISSESNRTSPKDLRLECLEVHFTLQFSWHPLVCTHVWCCSAVQQGNLLGSHRNTQHMPAA